MNSLSDTASPAPAAAVEAPAERIVSVDAFRGFVMFLMMAEVMHLTQAGKWLAQKGIAFGDWLAFHTSHVTWSGCSLHDMIQPSFSFLVGTALVFSVEGRRRKGHTGVRMWLHAAWRALLLILLGVWLRSLGDQRTDWTFEDTLSQIGLGYLFLFGLGFCARRTQWIAFAVILAGYWAAFALYPVPENYDYAAVNARLSDGEPGEKDWVQDGFAAHWNKNSNLAWQADTHILNWFRGGTLHTVSRPEPWKFNGGGYSTLSFIPTLATMIFGLLAGGALRAGWTGKKRFAWLGIAGAAGIALGLALHYSGLCPMVKRIWTPSWVLYSGGLCCLILAAFHAVADVAGWRKIFFPLIVIGMNSIAAYLIAHLTVDLLRGSLLTHLGPDLFIFAADGPGPPFPKETILGAAVFLIQWLMLLWMYRRKIFLRV